MSDTVNTQVVRNGREYVVTLTNESDGTGESAVAKVDLSAITNNGATPTYSTIYEIEYQVSGFNYVVLEWNHTTPDEIAVLKGSGLLTWPEGLTDPRTSGGTGDIQLTTDGPFDGAGYTITIRMKLK